MSSTTSIPGMSDDPRSSDSAEREDHAQDVDRDQQELEHRERQHEVFIDDVVLPREFEVIRLNDDEDRNGGEDDERRESVDSDDETDDADEESRDSTDPADESGDLAEEDDAGEAAGSGAADAAEPSDSTGTAAGGGRNGGDRKRPRKDFRRERGLPPRLRIEIQPMSGPGNSSAAPGSQVMVVNDIPGEECRIAILENGRLEALYSERNSTATNVGNIYKGRVTNVEAAIQAAFVDFGEAQSGFLHISDLHPRYFPGAERKERMGKKIPRRDRPPIQEALRRGDEVLVQVLKQGIGTKGPTLTSYLSIPGRLLVMMPGMDCNGVSRKVEDEDQRRAMRKILDSLELPDGFGFILRTAGFDQTKEELQRDAAYLTRLWNVMEDRMKRVGAPCELYTESDLLIRTIRDIVGPEIKAIVVDNESAFNRVSAFLRVVAPRAATKVLHYRESTPIFHAFDVERQIELIHARIVPLPSGGALVIDQTEALVAIDVNSGRSRQARDSETNAYHTNCEAVDEICRQIRLRDLGGLIINDLIDMRSPKHRRDVQERLINTLRKDRARTTILPISEFGILEMTRQRMRPSMRKAHFMDCPHCAGHGEIKMPDSVASDALRHIGYLMRFDRIRRVEMVCSGKVASVLLSGKRRMLVEMEDAHRKRIDIRISDALASDRVDYYAYDDRGADVDLTKLPPLAIPRLDQLESAPIAAAPVADAAPDDAKPARRDSGRRRRRNKSGPADATAIALEGGADGWGANVAASAAPTAPVRGRDRGPKRDRHQNGQPKPSRGGPAPAAPAPVPPVAPAPEPVDEKIKRVFEIAKELGVPSKEVVARCVAESEPSIKNHMSAVAPPLARTIRSWFAPEPEPAPPDESSVAEGATMPGSSDSGGGDESERRRRRRRRRGGRNRSGGQSSQPVEAGSQQPKPPHHQARPPQPQPKPRPEGDRPQGPNQGQGGGAAGGQAQGEGRRRRRRGRGGRGEGPQGHAGQPTRGQGGGANQGGSGGGASASSKPASTAPFASSSPTPMPRRTLFGTRAKVSPVARTAAKKGE